MSVVGETVDCRDCNLQTTEKSIHGCGYSDKFCEWCWIDDQFVRISKCCPNCNIPLCHCQECEDLCDVVNKLEKGDVYHGGVDLFILVGLCHKCKKFQYLTEDACIRHECSAVVQVLENPKLREKVLKAARYIAIRLSAQEREQYECVYCNALNLVLIHLQSPTIFGAVLPWDDSI